MSQSRNRPEKLSGDHLRHKVIAEVLAIALTSEPLQVKLQQVLDTIFAEPLFGFNPKGCIFLKTSGRDLLRMVAQKNFSPEQAGQCAEIPFGQCICGRAARNRTLSLVKHDLALDPVGSHHEASPHGHFCAPILDQDQLLGILNIYTPPDVKETAEVMAFLTGVTHALAHMISRQRSEELLTQQKELFESVLNNIPHSVFWKDLNLIYRGCNRNFARTAGLSSPDEIIGRTDFEMPWSHRQAESYRTMDRQVLSSGEPALNYEQTMRQADGRESTLLTSKVPLYNEQGQPTGVLGIFSDITEQRELRNRLQQLNLFDQLTNLPNQTLFLDRAEQARLSAQRQADLFAIGVLDLDNFKKVNSSLGHEAGDQVLCQVATRLQEALPDFDTAARMGGDAFLLLFTNLHRTDEVPRRIRELLALFEPPFHVNRQEVFITASVGLALFPEDGGDVQALLRNADTALHRAKDLGRNGYQLYSPSMNASSLMYLNLESNLRKAITQDQLELFFQPQFDARTGQVIGAEALVRWRHPELGLVPPGDFIPLAEETGLIVDIGSWVINQACEKLKALQDSGYHLPRVAVNLSARQFHHHDIIGTVCAALLDSGLPPEGLELEITESAVMGDPEEAFRVLDYFREMGVTVAVDDFGTGYSSLSYLKRFPLDMLKIDRSFIKNIVSDPDNAAIVMAIIAMARQLRLKVLAEGVETEAQRDFLREQGCDLFQGFLYCRPLEEDRFKEFLQQA